MIAEVSARVNDFLGRGRGRGPGTVRRQDHLRLRSRSTASTGRRSTSCPWTCYRSAEVRRPVRRGRARPRRAGQAGGDHRVRRAPPTAAPATGARAASRSSSTTTAAPVRLERRLRPRRGRAGRLPAGAAGGLRRRRASTPPSCSCSRSTTTRTAPTATPATTWTWPATASSRCSRTATATRTRHAVGAQGRVRRPRRLLRPVGRARGSPVPGLRLNDGPAGGGGEAVGERGDEVAQFVGSLDDERQVERRRAPPGSQSSRSARSSTRSHSLRPVAPQAGSTEGRDAGGKAGADLLDGAVDAQGHLVPVRRPWRTRTARAGRRRGRPAAANEPGRVRASAMRSSRKVRSSPSCGSAPVTYQRPEWATRPYGCSVRCCAGRRGRCTGSRPAGGAHRVGDGEQDPASGAVGLAGRCR